MIRSRLQTTLIVGVLALAALALSFQFAPAQTDSAKKAATAARARTILEMKCKYCHGATDPDADLNVLDRASLLDAARTKIAVVLGKPDESNLIKRIESPTRPMPPKKEYKPLSKEDVAVLRQWIEDGADFGPTRTPGSTEPSEQLAVEAREILNEYCARCHGYTKRDRNLNVLDRGSLLDARRRSGQKEVAIAPGKPEASQLIALIEDGSMPDGENAPKVPAEKVKTLKAWIAAGAPAFPVPAVPPVETVTPVVNQTSTKLALHERVEKVFRSKCGSCHGGSKPDAGLRILNHKDLVDRKYIVPGKPAESRVLPFIQTDRMPPKGQGLPPLSDDEKRDVQDWINAGAVAFNTLPVNGASADYVLQQIVADVGRLRANPRFDDEKLKSYRYVSFNHLLAAGVTSDELQAHVRSLALAINHVSQQTEFEKPVPIDGAEGRPATVFRINLENLGWHEPAFRQRMQSGRQMTLWDLIMLEYPYAMLSTGSASYTRAVREYLSYTDQLRPVMYVRGDWLMTTVTRTPLYEDLLRLPFDLSKLEERLGVDSQANVDSGRARRGGVTVSGVSRNNRVVERHQPRGLAYYWKSHDFKTSTGVENMFRDPINFSASGGEMIWTLPNGMQAYYVCDNKGNRIDAAPTEIVTDEFASDKIVRNGLACIRCHQVGMRSFQDDVLPALTSFRGTARAFSMEHAERLYAPQQEMDALLEKDGKAYTTAMEKLFGTNKVDGGVIIAPSQRFLEEKVNGLSAAAELGLSDLESVRSQFRSADAVKLGMPQLAERGAIRRDAWEDYYDQVVRSMAIADAVPNLNAAVRRDYQPIDAPFELEVTLNKPAVQGKRKLLNVILENKKDPKRTFFAAGDNYVITIVNKTGSEVHLEGYIHGVKGKKRFLDRLVIPAGATEELGEGTIGPTPGTEQFVFYASDDDFPRGELLSTEKASEDRGEMVSARIVHPLYELRPGRNVETKYDPHRIVKRSFDIETH